MKAASAIPGFSRRQPIYGALLMALALLPAGCDRQNDEVPKAGAQPAQQQVAPAAPAAPAAAETPPPTQAPAPTPLPPPAKPLTELESLVAPIALYPDPLLAELLVASTYPLEVVQAARWLDSKPDLSTLNSKNWDASVQRLVSVPQVVKMMSDHLDWTTQLGDAFLANPAELMDTVQALRKRAKDSGFLKDTPEQKVAAQQVSARAPDAEAAESGVDTEAKVTPAVLRKEVITIEPAKADTVYVPQYDPQAAYQAPLAPPPATTASYAYPAAGTAAAPAYYPAYYPPPATTTTTSSTTTDSLMTFGTGAVVGGLLTWGLMEWADNDDWDDHYHGGYYPVNHYYGGAVCNNGNCWQGGGGGNYDRGNINRNTNLDRDVNISGNEINVNRGGVFSQSNLKPAQRPAGWTPDARHRRGQKYPEAVQQRLGRTEQPGLAGQRLGAAQTLPASTRGFGGRSGQSVAAPKPVPFPTDRRMTQEEVRQQLAQRPSITEKRLEQSRRAAEEKRGAAGQNGRDDALAGLRESGRAAQLDSRRGAESRQQGPSNRQAEGGGSRTQRVQAQQPRPMPAEGRQPLQTRRAEPRQDLGGRERAQALDAQRRSERARPNAFEGGGDRTNSFSQRGAASRQASFAGGGRQGGAAAGGGGARAGGGGGGRMGGGGRRR